MIVIFTRNTLISDLKKILPVYEKFFYPNSDILWPFLGINYVLTNQGLKKV